MSEAGAALTLSDQAAAKVRKLRESEGNDGLKLRVYITVGGCAGFSYGFTFDEALKDATEAAPAERQALMAQVARRPDAKQAHPVRSTMIF